MSFRTVAALTGVALACSPQPDRGDRETASAQRIADSAARRSDTTSGTSDARPDSLESLIAFVRNHPDCRQTFIDTFPQTIHLTAAQSEEFEPAFFCFASHEARYGITSGGQAVRLASTGPIQSFRVRVDTASGIELVRYKATSNALYVYYQVTSGGDGMGYLDRFAIPELRRVWSAPASVSINLGPALMLGDSLAYVSGLNVVGKVQLRDGVYRWKHLFFNEDLEAARLSHFTAFLLPEQRDSTVRFPAWSTTPDTIVVDDRTGVILAPAVLRDHQSICPRDPLFC